MKRKVAKIVIIWGFFIILWMLCCYSKSGCIFGNDMLLVRAQQNVQYTYDSLGRVISAVYPNGTTMKYVYDKNGNLRSVMKEEGKSASDTEEPQKNIQSQVHESLNGGQIAFVPHNTIEESRIYNTFKKKKPTIKSLKVVKKKGKRYLNIQIRQAVKRGAGSERGYQIKYATDRRFKRSKTISVTRVKKGTVTKKQWKVSKNKTYYVKVRAYMKTRLGKNVYSKYSTTKKIHIRK